MEKIREVNKVFLITVASAVMVSFFMGSILSSEEHQLMSLLVSQAVYAVPMLIYLISNRASPLEALRIHKIKPLNVLLLVIFAYLITPVLNLLNAVSMLFSTNVINSSLAGILTKYPLWVGLGAIALVPGILEECVYRGVFFNEYRKKNPLLGILISGLLFGLMHLNFNQFIYAFVMGVIFALLVEACDSLLASIIVHFAINANSVILSRNLPEVVTVYSKQELLFTICSLIIPAALMAVLAAWLLKIIMKLEGRQDAIKNLFINGNKKRETVITLPLVLGMGICLALMVYLEVFNHFFS